MLSKVFGEAPKAEVKKRARDPPAEAAPVRRSGRERKVVSYAPQRETPLSGYVLLAYTSLGSKAKDGLTWPTLAALTRPNFEDDDPRVEGLFQSTRSCVQNLLKTGRLRRQLVREGGNPCSARGAGGL
jgi:hypothetical protein